MFVNIYNFLHESEIGSKAARITSAPNIFLSEAHLDVCGNIYGCKNLLQVDFTVPIPFMQEKYMYTEEELLYRYYWVCVTLTPATAS